MRSKRKFSKEAIKTISTSGAVAPSSRFSVEKMMKGVDFSKDVTIVELGVGNGVVTHQIIQNMSPDSRLIALEINENLLAEVYSWIPNHPNISLHHHSAFEITDLLSELGIDQVDYFISTLPIAIFKKEDNQRLLKQIRQHLSPDGKYVQIQYSFLKYWMVKKNFPNVEVRMAVMNLPPAFVFFCSL